METSSRKTPIIHRAWLYCFKCGLCCHATEMILLESDLKLISQYTGLDHEEFSVKKGRFRVLKNVDGRCFFYDQKTGTCRIYAARPIGCSLYPLVFSEDGHVEVDDYCPLSRLIPSYEKRKAKLLGGEILRELFSRG